MKKIKGIPQGHPVPAGADFIESKVEPNLHGRMIRIDYFEVEDHRHEAPTPLFGMGFIVGLLAGMGLYILLVSYGVL